MNPFSRLFCRLAKAQPTVQDYLGEVLGVLDRYKDSEFATEAVKIFLHEKEDNFARGYVQYINGNSIDQKPFTATLYDIGEGNTAVLWEAQDGTNNSIWIHDAGSAGAFMNYLQRSFSAGHYDYPFDEHDR